MVRVDEQYNVRLSDFFAQSVSFLGQRRGIDNRSGDILRRPNAGRDRYLREYGLYLVGHENILDQRGDQTGLSRSFVPADAYPY